MKITYLGTGAAEGFPAMFCNCAYCNNLRKTYPGFVRTRSQTLIDEKLCIDFPPEAYAHSLSGKLNLSSLRYALITHSHMDHFYAHDFILRGYKYAVLESDVLDIYGNEEVGKVFAECTAREMKPDVAEHTRFNLVRAYSSLKVGDYDILTLPAMHGTAEEALLYYIRRDGKGYLHLHDTGDLSPEAVAFLKESGARADLVTYDCTFLEAAPVKGARHLCIEKVMDIAQNLKEAGVTDSGTVSVISHFSHNCNPTPERLAEVEKKYGVVAAYDGMTIDI